MIFSRFKYKLTHGNGELYLFGESIHDDSHNIIPISFLLEIKNYVDREKNNGKQVFIMNYFILLNVKNSN